MSYPYPERISRVSGELSSFISRLSNASLAVPLMFVMLFLWLNGTALWGAYWETSTALAYLIMFSIVFGVGMAQKNQIIWLTKLKMSVGMRNFWIGFLLMFAGLIAINQFVLKGNLSGNQISISAVYPQIALTALFVAPVEETIFRGVLKDYFANWRFIIPLGLVLTSVLFAITHYAVYGGQVMSLWWAVVMGGIFYLLTDLKLGRGQDKLGVPASIGAHTCYNLFVLGILSGGIISAHDVAQAISLVVGILSGGIV